MRLIFKVIEVSGDEVWDGNPVNQETKCKSCDGIKIENGQYVCSHFNRLLFSASKNENPEPLPFRCKECKDSEIPTRHPSQIIECSHSCSWLVDNSKNDQSIGKYWCDMYDSSLELGSTGGLLRCDKCFDITTKRVQKAVEKCSIYSRE